MSKEELLLIYQENKRKDFKKIKELNFCLSRETSKNFKISNEMKEKLKYLMNYASSKLKLSLTFLGFSLTSIIFIYPYLYYYHEIVVVIALCCTFLIVLGMSIFLFTGLSFQSIEKSILKMIIFKENCMLVGDLIKNLYQKIKILNYLFLLLGILPFLISVSIYIFAFILGMYTFVIITIIIAILFLFGTIIGRINKKTAWFKT